jgi:light-regulated signal transduction histidine kinase (bacteriophytochrome)
MRFWSLDDDSIILDYKDDNHDELCERCLSENIKGICHRGRYANRVEAGASKLIFCHDKNTTAKQAKYIAKLTVTSLNKLVKIAKDVSSSLNEVEAIAYHNAKKMNASIGQKVDQIIDLETLNSTNDKLGLIKDLIENEPEKVARNVMFIRKTVQQIESEYNLIDSNNIDELLDDSQLTSVKIHKLLVGACYFYREECDAVGVKVFVSPTDAEVKVDYGIAKSAFGQVFSNISKYAKPHSKIQVNTRHLENFIDVCFEMESLYFEPAEVESMGRLNVRGVRAIKANRYSKSSSGIGLYAIRKFMHMHGGYYKMVSDKSTQYKSSGLRYSSNRISLGFPVR